MDDFSGTGSTVKNFFSGRTLQYILIGVAVACLLLYVIMNKGCSMYAHNGYAKDWGTYEAQLKSLESYHDKMWKTIDQKAQVLTMYKGDVAALYAQYTEVFKHIMAEGGDGLNTRGTVQPATQGGAQVVVVNTGQAAMQPLLYNFLKVNGIPVTDEMYRDLSRTIENDRNHFHEEQRKAAQYAANVNLWLDTEPWSSYNAGKKRAEFEPITSSRTKDAVRTGRDDDTTVFKK